MSSQCSLACGTNRWIIQIIGAMLRRREHKSFLEQLGKTSELKWDIGRIRRNIILSEGTHCVFCFRFPGVLCVYKENVEKLAPVSFHDKGLPWDKHERFHWNNSWKGDSEEARERERNEGGHYSWTHGGGRTPLRSLGGWAPGLRALSPRAGGGGCGGRTHQQHSLHQPALPLSWRSSATIPSVQRSSGHGHFV